MKPDITLIAPRSPFLLNEKPYPPLGILYLSAFLKERGLSCQCLDMGYGHTPDMAEADIIGLSVTTPQWKEAFELLGYFKAQGKKVIVGGPHATHNRMRCYEAGFDFVVSGYGEASLYNYLTGDTISQPNLEDLPFPDRDALPVANYEYKVNDEPCTVIMTSRGCPYRCSFCAKISDEFFLNSAERVISEVLAIDRLYGFKAFMIFDDIFIANKKRLEKISTALRGENYIFRCFGRSGLLSEDVCRLLAEMNVVEVGIGIESGSNEVLKRNLKATSVNTNTKAIHNLKKYGIRSKAFLIIGLPGETEETVKETERWIETAQPDDIDCSVLQPLPGSLLYENPEKFEISFTKPYLKMGTWDGSKLWYKGTPGEYEANIRTKALSSARIVELRDNLENKFKKKDLLK